MSEALKCTGKDILLIGVGDSIVVEILKMNGKNVTTFDYDKNLKPDIVGAVTEIDKIINKKYDIIICCQVLEHIPYEYFQSIIEKLSLLVNEKLILSLPNYSYWWELYIKVPKIEIKLKIPTKKFFRKKWDINKQGKNEHYWEINAKEYEKSKIDIILKKYFILEKYFVPEYNSYHMFYILMPKNK